MYLPDLWTRSALAADILSPAFGPPLQVWRAIARSGILIDQVNEFGRWCHVGFAPKGTPPGTNYSLANAAIGYELGSRNP